MCHRTLPPIGDFFLEPIDSFLPRVLGLLARTWGCHMILLSSQGWSSSPKKAGSMPRSQAARHLYGSRQSALYQGFNKGLCGSQA